MSGFVKEEGTVKMYHLNPETKPCDFHMKTSHINASEKKIRYVCLERHSVQSSSAPDGH